MRNSQNLFSLVEPEIELDIFVNYGFYKPSDDEKIVMYSFFFNFSTVKKSIRI